MISHVTCHYLVVFIDSMEYTIITPVFNYERDHKSIVGVKQKRTHSSHGRMVKISLWFGSPDPNTLVWVNEILQTVWNMNNVTVWTMIPLFSSTIEN